MDLVWVAIVVLPVLAVAWMGIRSGLGAPDSAERGCGPVEPPVPRGPQEESSRAPVAAVPRLTPEQVSDLLFEDWMDRKAERVGGDWFHAKVAGVSFPNDDGSSRQEILLTLEERAELRLKPDPQNRFDPNAVAVYAPGERQVGFLDGRLAGETVRAMRSGMKYRVFVHNVTGGDEGYTRGCNIAVLRWYPETAEE